MKSIKKKSIDNCNLSTMYSINWKFIDRKSIDWKFIDSRRITLLMNYIVDRLQLWIDFLSIDFISMNYIVDRLQLSIDFFLIDFISINYIVDRLQLSMGFLSIDFLSINYIVDGFDWVTITFMKGVAWRQEIDIDRHRYRFKNETFNLKTPRKKLSTWKCEERKFQLKIAGKGDNVGFDWVAK